MIPKSHPYWHVRVIVDRSPNIIAVPLSYYSYRPQSVDDARTPLLVSARDFVQSEKIETIIAGTPAGHELALHSDFRLANGERRHLVMIDMATSSRAHLDKLRGFLGDHFFQRITWFSSGRSFHGYGEDLLSQDDWVHFMGLLLLANKPRFEPTVDPRWIGHRLLGGYAALRWTKNTDHYLVTPTSIDQRDQRQATTANGRHFSTLRRDR